jgi:hypothetical protein
MSNQSQLLKAAQYYHQHKIACIATNDNKRAILPWKDYQTRLPTTEEITQQFAHPKAKGIAIICGAVSGNLEIIDVDLKNDVSGDLFHRLMDQLGEIGKRLYCVQTRSGGYHLGYKCEVIDANLKLANRPATPDEIAANPNAKQLCLIETRGEGGYVIAPPTEGYNRLSEFHIPIISIDEREHIMTVCRSFNEIYIEEKSIPTNTNARNYGTTPWDDYNAKSDVVELLTKHGWTRVEQSGERIRMKRPGTTTAHSSGDYHTGLNLFKVFTTSTQFDTERAYKPFAVYAILEHNGDFSKAAKQLVADGFGEAAANVEKKLNIKINQALATGRTKDQITDLLMMEDKRSRDEANVLINNVMSQRGDTILEFWDTVTTNAGTRITISRQRFIQFLYNNGFHLFFYDQKVNGFIIVRQMDGLVIEVTPENIKKFVKNYIQSLPETFDMITPPELLEVVMKGNETYFGKGLIEFMDAKQLDLLRDDANTAYFTFTNGIIKITTDKIQLLKYNQIDGRVVWKSQVIDFNIDIDFDVEKDAEFYEFMELVAGNDVENTMYLVSMVGYLLHQYKDPSKPFAVILAEETEDENKGGGTGKGILVKALSKLAKIETVDGKNFKLDKSFAFQRVGLDTEIIAIEDMRKNVDFEGFYPIITEGITIEKKNKDEMFIPFADSPKIIFTTNYTIPSTGDHAKRRQRVFEFSNFFSATKSPLDHFGHRLFDDWDRDEWNRFYNLLFHCVQIYLKDGIIHKPNSDKLHRKHIRLNYTADFLDWWDGFIETNIGQPNAAKSLYNEFLLANDLDKKDFSSKRFKKALTESCEKFGYCITDSRVGTEKVLHYTIKTI